MLDPIVIKEHSSKEIKNCNLTKLHNYIKRQKLTAALRVTPIGVETKSWVGVIKYKNLQFQILPKLIYTKEYKENEKERAGIKASILKNLIYMNGFLC